jgi:hypothetical protein
VEEGSLGHDDIGELGRKLITRAETLRRRGTEEHRLIGGAVRVKFVGSLRDHLACRAIRE